MPLVKNKVGDTVLAWTPTLGQPGSTTCVISAHGGHGWITPRKRLGNVTLHFYCEHGYKLIAAPSLSNFISGRYAIAETVQAGQKFQDYTLGKYENTGAGETAHNTLDWNYDNVRAVPETMANAAAHYQGKANTAQADLTAMNTRIAQFTAAPGRRLDLMVQEAEGWQALQTLWASQRRAETRSARLQDMANRFGRSMDIITIRSRSWHGNPTLTEVIATLDAAGYAYTTVHCFFCRSNMDSPFKQPGQTPYANFG